MLFCKILYYCYLLNCLFYFISYFYTAHSSHVFSYALCTHIYIGLLIFKQILLHPNIDPTDTLAGHRKCEKVNGITSEFCLSHSLVTNGLRRGKLRHAWEKTQALQKLQFVSKFFPLHRSFLYNFTVPSASRSFLSRYSATKLMPA